MDQGEIGDIFRPQHWPGMNTKCSSWHVTIQDSQMGRRGSNHKILFRHSLTGGNWVLIVDGRIEVAGYEPSTNAQFSVSFKLGSQNAFIACEYRTAVFNYEHAFFIDNVEQMPFSLQPHSTFNESIPAHITIPSHIARLDANKYVIYYQIDVRTADGNVVTVHRRYSEFDQLDNSMRSLLDGHLRSSLPSLPGKVYNPFVNQMSEKFLEDRQLVLQQYLQSLLGSSKCTYYTDFLCFLGLDPISGFPIT